LPLNQQSCDEECDKLEYDGSMIEDSKIMSKYDISFNNVLEIKKSSYSFIKEILNKKKPEWNMYINDIYLEFLYGQVLLAFKNKMSQDYIGKTYINKACCVEFENIFNILIEDYPTKVNSVNYQYYLLWKYIYKSYIRRLSTWVLNH
jgi:hypothetical protein